MFNNIYIYIYSNLRTRSRYLRRRWVTFARVSGPSLLGRQKLDFAAQARHLLDKCRSGKASKLLCARNHCSSVPSRLLCARNHCSSVPSRLLRRSKSLFERAFEATVRSKSLYEESCARPQRRSAPLRSAPLHSVHVYARVHTSIYISGPRGPGPGRIYIYTTVNPCISMHGAEWNRAKRCSV